MSSFFKSAGDWFKKTGESVYNSVLKPTYDHVLKPVGEKAWSATSKLIDSGTDMIGGMASLPQYLLYGGLAIGGGILLWMFMNPKETVAISGNVANIAKSATPVGKVM